MLLVCKYAFNVSRPLLIVFTRHYEGDAHTEEWNRNVGGRGQVVQDTERCVDADAGVPGTEEGH